MDDDQVYAHEIRWNLSEIRQAVPRVSPARPPDRLDAESLLVQQVAETEWERDEWKRIADSYRMLSEQAIQALAKLEDQNRKMRGLIENQNAELIERRR